MVDSDNGRAVVVSYDGNILIFNAERLDCVLLEGLFLR